MLYSGSTSEASFKVSQLVAFISEGFGATVTFVGFIAGVETDMVVHVLQNLGSIGTMLTFQPLVQPFCIIVLDFRGNVLGAQKILIFDVRVLVWYDILNV